MNTFSRTALLLGSIIMGIHFEAIAAWQGSAVLVVKPDKISGFKKAVARIIGPTRKEKGCISYYGYQVVDETGVATNRFEFHEIWTTKEAMLVDHKENSAHMKAFFREIKAETPGSYLESFEVSGKSVQVL